MEACRAGSQAGWPSPCLPPSTSDAQAQVLCWLGEGVRKPGILSPDGPRLAMPPPPGANCTDSSVSGGLASKGMGGGSQPPQPSYELLGSPGPKMSAPGAWADPSGALRRFKGAGPWKRREGKAVGIRLVDLWTAQELGGSPGDFQAKPSRPGYQGAEVEVRRMSKKQGGSPLPPGHSASMCCTCPDSIEDAIQRKESLAKKQGLQTPSIAHSPPLQTLN